MHTLCPKQRIKWIFVCVPLFLNTDKQSTQSYTRQQIIKTRSGWPQLVVTKKRKKCPSITSQLKAFPQSGAKNKAGRDRKERTRDTHGWEKGDENNSHKDFGDRGKRYKPENAESIVVCCQAEGFKPRLKPSFGGNSFHSHHSQHLWLPRERGGGGVACDSVSEGERAERKTEHKSVGELTWIYSTLTGKHPLWSSAQPWNCV